MKISELFKWKKAKTIMERVIHLRFYDGCVCNLIAEFNGSENPDFKPFFDKDSKRFLRDFHNSAKETVTFFNEGHFIRVYRKKDIKTYQISFRRVVKK